MNGLEAEKLMSLLDNKFHEEVLRFVRKHKDAIRDQLNRGEKVAVPTSSGTIYLIKGETMSNREQRAAEFIRQSGKAIHSSDCATSVAPAEEPGPCDCEPTLTCSEVVERLAGCYSVKFLPNDGLEAKIDRVQIAAILDSWRERRVRELEGDLLYVRGLLWKLRNTAKSALTDAKFESDEYLANSEQIRKGAKHE